MISDFNQEFLEIVETVEKCLQSRELLVTYNRNGYPNNEKLTLEEISKKVGGVTRERVRQIEQKALKKLNHPSIRTDILLKFTLCFEEMFHLFRKNSFDGYEDFLEPSFITFPEYISIIDEDLFYKTIAIFLAITKNKARIRVSQEFRFVYNSNGVSETDAALTILGLYKNIISVDEVSQLDETSKAILLSNYRFVNGVYMRKGVIKRDVILAIIDEHFPNGYHISNNEHYNKFKSIYKEIYHMDCPMTQREIGTAMGNAGNYCLVDKGTYLNYDKCSKIPQELLDDIVTYVLQDGGTLYYSTIFNEFRAQLCAEGIDNWFYFKGTFDRQSNGMFFTRRATLSVNSTKQFEDPIYDYIAESTDLITMQELRNRFPGVKDYLFLFRISGNPEILALDGGKFVHVKNLSLNRDDLVIIKQFVRRSIRESDYGIVSSRTLYPLLKVENKELCKRLGTINEQFGFFSLCNYLMDDELEFSRPFIGKKGTEDMTLTKILSRYVEDYLPNRFSFSDLDMYASRYNTFVNNKLGFIEDVAEKYLLVNDKEFVKTDEVTIENAEQIKKFLVFTVKKFKEIKISNFRSYFLIPKNENIYWNKVTLFSFINAFCSDELEIKLINNSFENLDYIVRSVEE